jgi:predicted nucleic acid-binding protein
LSDVVIDASVALAWCFPDEGNDYADAVLAALDNGSGVVPAVWALEVTNGVILAERRKRIAAPEIRRLSELLRGLPIREDSMPVSFAISNLLPLAREYGLAAYDAAYLELAIRYALPLATLDRTLEKAARKAGTGIFAAPPRS